MKYSNVFLYALTFVLTSCSGFRANDDIKSPVITLNLSSLRETGSGELVRSVVYCNLESKSPEAYFTYISKMIVRDDVYYIADRMSNRILMFGLDGEFVGKIDRKGKGPGEYLALSDFDIDRDGKLHILDAVQKKVVTLNSNMEFERSRDFGFSVASFTILDNYNFLLDIPCFNADDALSNAKLVLADSLLAVQRKWLYHLPYADKNFDFEQKITRCGDILAYNRAVSDTVYAFSVAGEPLHKYFLDFGRHCVPAKLNNNLEKLYSESNNYAFLPYSPYLSNDFFVSNMRYSNHDYSLIYNLKKQLYHLISSQTANFPDVLFRCPILMVGDSTLATVLDSEVLSDEQIKTLPPHVAEHIKSGNSSLCLITLNVDAK